MTTHATPENTDALTITADQALDKRHVTDGFGLPYGEAGVVTCTTGPKPFTRATVTCPVCGHVALGRGPKQAGQDYAAHFDQRAKAEATVDAGHAFPIRLLFDSTHRMPGEPLVTDYEAGTVLLAIDTCRDRLGEWYLVPWFDGSVRGCLTDRAERIA